MGSINANYNNRMNVISIGEAFNATLYTDRNIASSAAAPSGASHGDMINRTETTAGVSDRGGAYSAPGSGSFNPGVLN